MAASGHSIVTPPWSFTLGCTAHCPAATSWHELHLPVCPHHRPLILTECKDHSCLAWTEQHPKVMPQYHSCSSITTCFDARFLRHLCNLGTRVKAIDQCCSQTTACNACRGVVTTSPSPTFLVLTNNTKTRQAREHSQRAPAYLDWMTYHEFTALGSNTSHLRHYNHEFHYFQGTPHEELKLKDSFGSLPSSCWNAQHSGKVSIDFMTCT